MNSNSSASPSSTENLKLNLAGDSLLQCLNQEFAKFESVAKDCDRYTVVDVSLPVRIIELYYKIFKMCVDNTVIRQNIDNVELFMKIFLAMKLHFKTECNCDLEIVTSDDEDDDNEDDDSDDSILCDETDPLKRFLHLIANEEVKKSTEIKDKMMKELKDAQDWLLQQKGYLICEICNSKFINPIDMVNHAQTDTHIKNLSLFKTNELFAAFPDPDNETFGCKVCKSEYSTFNSLVKHFSKPQHDDAKNKRMNGDAQSKTEPKKSNETKPKPTASNTNVVMTFKTKKGNDSSKPNITNGTKPIPTGLPLIKTIPGKNGKPMHIVAKEEPKPADNIPAKSKSKNTANVAKATESQPSDNVSAKSRPKNTTAGVKTAQSTSDPINSTCGAKTAQSKASDPVSTKSPSKTNPTEVKTADPVSTKSHSKNTTSGVKTGQPKSSTPISTKSASSKPSGVKNPPSSVQAAPKPSYSSRFIVSKDSGCKYCQICARDLPNEDAILAHVQGCDHSSMVSTFESNQEYVKMSICGSHFFCTLCSSKYPNIHNLARHFGEKEHRDSINSTSESAPTPAPAKPVLKPKNILIGAKLRDTDKKFFRQRANRAQCTVCNCILSSGDDLIDHVSDKKHTENVLDFIKHENLVQLPNDKVATFNCLKCAATFDSFGVILSHCKDHVEPVPKPFKLSKSDEKFISKGKSEKSSRCNLCDKELPTEAALISHTGSSNHVKNFNTLTKNEPYCAAGKISCSLCDLTCHDLASLVKHFKTDTHQKTIVKGKKPQNQTPIHIPSYSKPKLDQIVVSSVPEPAKATPKKKKHEETPVRKSRLQLVSMSDVNFEEVTFEQFPMKRPDNSYVIAKNDIFYCRICDSDLPSVAVAAHMNGATHRINVEVFESMQCHVLSTEDCVQCTFCKLTFHHVHQLVKHFRDKIHAKSAPAQDEKQPEPDPVLGLTSTDLSEKFDSTSAQNVKETKPEKATISPKRVKIPKYERKHIFRLAGTVIQCNFCNTKLSDNDALEAHIANLNHKRNSTVYRENETLIRQLDSVGVMFECIACDFSGDLNKVIKHCKKRQHAAAKGCEDAVSEEEILEEEGAEVDPTISEFDLKCITMKNGIVRCKICHSKLTGEKNLLEHMSSSNHNQSSIVYKTNEPFIEIFDELGYSYKCTICEVIFTRLDTMIRHFAEAPGHVQPTLPSKSPSPAADSPVFNVRTHDFECILCSTRFAGFANLSRHCHSAQHEVLKNIIQNEQNEIPYNITITDYQYHCNACDIRLLNKALMEKHLKKRNHQESATFYGESTNGEFRPNVVEIVGYEYLCNLCWFPMYSAAELAVHEQSYMHKSGKDFDDVWRFNEKHLIMCENMYKVRCKLCEKTIGIEKFIKHCTSRDHRMKFIANHAEESAQDQHIVWRNATQYCTLCDCKLINNHNLVNHVNSEKHKLKMLQN